MASDVVFDAVQSYMNSAWAATPLQFENEPPVARSDVDGNAIPWVLVEMTGNLYGQVSIGADTQAHNRWDEEGQVFCHVFTPTGTGGHTARHHAKALADLFRGTTLLDGNLEFLDASIGLGEIGSEDGAWFRVSISVDYRHMEA